MIKTKAPCVWLSSNLSPQISFPKESILIYHIIRIEEEFLIPQSSDDEKWYWFEIKMLILIHLTIHFLENEWKWSALIEWQQQKQEHSKQKLM